MERIFVGQDYFTSIFHSRTCYYKHTNCCPLLYSPGLVCLLSCYIATIPEFVRNRKKSIYTLSELLRVLFLCTVLDRFITNYIALPCCYHQEVTPVPLLEPRRATTVVLFFRFSSGLMLTIKMVRTLLEDELAMGNEFHGRKSHMI